MEDVPDFLLKVFTMARETPPAEFHGSILREVKNWVCCDAAVCGGARWSSNAPIPVGLNLKNLEVQFLLEWCERVPAKDPIRTFVMANLGHVITTELQQSYKSTPDLVEIALRHRIQYFAVLQTQVKGECNHQFMGLCRTKEGYSGLSPQHQSLERVMPHLAEAHLINHAIHQSNSASSLYSMAAAVAERATGKLFVADGQFSDALSQEWPGFCNTLVPRPLFEKWKTQPSFDYIGRHFDFKVQICGLLVYLAASARKVRASYLTPRQEEIAKLISVGLSYKEIAKLCDISPNTVRNHLAQIYDVLGVNGKVQLTNFLINRSESRLPG